MGAQRNTTNKSKKQAVRSEHMVVFGCDRHTHRRSSLLSPHLAHAPLRLTIETLGPSQDERPHARQRHTGEERWQLGL